VEVNDAVSEPALVQEHERDMDVVEQCALAATNNDRPEERVFLVDQACVRLTEATQPGRSVDASGLKAPRPRGAGLALLRPIVVGSS
jgi:hypothetical protein